MSEFVGRVIISSAATICVGGAAAFWSLQASTNVGSLWPLPALALLDWGVLGFAGFLSARPGPGSDPLRPAPGPWAIGGALLSLAFISAFSIGPFVLLSAALFLIGAAWEALRRSRISGRDLEWMAGGLVGNLVLLFLFISLG